MDEVRYGLIGAGMMGQEHIRNVALLDGARIAAIYDPDPAMARAAAGLAPGAVSCETAEALVARADLDAIVVASPNNLHLGQIEAIARARPRPLLVEKPLYTDPAGASRIAALARAYPAPIWVAMEYRYMPAVALFLDQVATETGGIRMLSIREHRFPFLDKVGAWNRFNATTGGTLVEKCCHFFDLMRLILHDEPVRVTASAGQAVNHLEEVYDGRVPDIWDHGYVLVDFAGGARAMLELCMFAEGSDYQEHLSAIGARGKVEAHVIGPTRFWPRDLGDPPVSKVVVSPRHPRGPRTLPAPVDPALLGAGDHNGATFYQHQRFLACIREGAAPEVTLADGAAAVRMGLAAQRAAETGQAVTL